MVNQRILVSAKTRLHVSYVTASQHHVNIMIIIAIHCDSLYTSCQFLKTGLVDHMEADQLPSDADKSKDSI